MHHATNSSYRGFSITTRWSEAPPHRKDGAHWFKASFTVDPDDAGDSSWQQFPDSEFATIGAASANALRAAQLSVDVHGARGFALSHSAWMVDVANLPAETRPTESRVNARNRSDWIERFVTTAKSHGVQMSGQELRAEAASAYDDLQHLAGGIGPN